VRASFLSGKDRSVANRLADFAMHEIDLDAGAVLETGCVYVVELAESLALPMDIAAAANAKSSTGRLDLLTRLITDRSIEFDRVEAGYAGPLYAEISPLTFSVLVRPGMRLNQIRFRRGAAEINDTELRALNAREPLVNGEALIDGGLGFSVDLTLRGHDGIVGWRARRHSGLIDLGLVNHYEPMEFWEPIHPGRHGVVILDPGAFYILVSREAVNVPPETAAEMVPYMAIAASATRPPAARARAGCSRCAATRPPSRWSTARWSGAWFMSAWPRRRMCFTAPGSARIIRGRNCGWQRISARSLNRDDIPGRSEHPDYLWAT
jgi:dCTP deaminase